MDPRLANYDRGPYRRPKPRPKDLDPERLNSLRQRLAQLPGRRVGQYRKLGQISNLPPGVARNRGASPQFNPGAFKERISDIGGLGMLQALNRQRGRVTPGGKDVAEQKVGILENRLGQTGNPVPPGPGVKPPFQNPGRPNPPGNAYGLRGQAPGQNRVNQIRRRMRKPRFRDQGRPVV